MPQLDIGSYRTQVNTLIVRFGRRYRTRTGWILPKLARVVKRRSKKAEQSRNMEGSRTQELETLSNTYAGWRADTRVRTNNSLEKLETKHNAWRLENKSTSAMTRYNGVKKK